MRRDHRMKPTFSKKFMSFSAAQLSFHGQEQQKHSSREQRHRREDDAPSPQPCRTQYDQEWEKTSIPVIQKDKRRGKLRLRLRYAPRKSAKPKQVSSADFNTREEAEAAASWWRLSWERATSTSIFKRSARQFFHTQPRATKYSYSY